jgi:hypothetical protein
MLTAPTIYVINRQESDITFPATHTHLPIDPKHFFTQLLVAAPVLLPALLWILLVPSFDPEISTFLSTSRQTITANRRIPG